MTILPSARQKPRTPPHASPAGHDAERSLVRVFATFTRAAASLKKSIGVRDQTAVVSTILLCNSPARFHLRRLLELSLPRVVVLSPTEIPAGISVPSLGMVR